MLNKIILMGRFTRDPELRRTSSGKSVASFCLAVDRDFKPDSGERECDFIECVAWAGTAELISRYFSKGRLAAAAGRLQVRGWTDKDGNKRRTTEVIVEDIYFADSKKDGSQQGGYTGGSYTAPTGYSVPEGNDYAKLEDDDAQLPF